ncbi:hypothetical protein [Seonamhaeicola sp.]|uniref:hypothetical protein n=1 Tax=Seonamhaeicola sp. TaxID=1912245 RepID=UPI002616079F|nr:hypothetical protein [Seonamhaeicola sp.]
MNIQLSAKSILKFLLVIIALLFLLNVVDIFLRVYLELDNPIINKLTTFFNFNYENSVPTAYSAVAILLCSILLFIISTDNNLSKSNSRKWLFLSLVFLFLFFDEIIEFHETIDYYVQSRLNTTGMLFFAWVIPYSLFVAVLGLVYIRFLWNLKKNIRTLFIVSGIIYVGGAIGMELFQAQIIYTTREHNIIYYIFTSIEELMEMLGIAIFIYALVLYIETEFEFFQLKI